MAQCRSCQASIMWVVMKKTGKTMPVDVKGAQVRVVLTEERRRTGENREAPVAIAVNTYVSHFATCPAAHKFRKDDDDAGSVDD